MAAHPLGTVLQQLRKIVRPAAPSENSDRQLLDRFVATHDEAAFADLVRRHGPLVLGVCRRLLYAGPDADDAFQATFLVLVRKAPSIPWQESIGSWLYQVAYRIALKARASAARRRVAERQGLDMPLPDLKTEASTRVDGETRALLDEELNRLPAKYRAPLVLCYLQGKTHDEAAQELGWPRGSMAKRLTRGQELLRDRLLGRGLALSAVPVLAGFATTAPAALSPALLNSTIKAATLFAAGEAAAGAVSAPAAALAEGALQTMFVNKLKTVAAAVLVLGILTVSAGWLLHSALAKPPASAQDPSLAVERIVVVNDPAQVKADRPVLVKGNTEFAFDLYGKLRGNASNVFYSPYSISTALGMTYAGARGDTAAQMAKAMHFDLPQERLHPAFGALIQEHNGAGKERAYKLSVANALWGQKDYGFLDDFVTLTRTSYGSGLREVDFSNDSDGARKAINDWVEKQTNDKIKDLFPQGSIDSRQRLVLVNAIHFKGDWDKQFKKELTKDGPFFVKADQKTDVPLMHQSGSYRYLEDDGFQLLELPYKGKELSMTVLLPKKVDGLACLEKQLSAATLNEWLGKARYASVNVTLPKFKMTTEFPLRELLSALGMPKAFTPQADLSGLNGKHDLYIMAAVHKAYVDVNEEGTEAAAATGVRPGTGRPQVPAEFQADHPFVFMIRDNRSGSILFLGRLVQPEK